MGIESCYELFVFTGTSALWKSHWVLYTHRQTHCPHRAEVEACDGFICFWVMFVSVSLEIHCLLLPCSFFTCWLSVSFWSSPVGFLLWSLGDRYSHFYLLSSFIYDVLDKSLPWYNKTGFSMYIFKCQTVTWLTTRNVYIQNSVLQYFIVFSHAMWQLLEVFFNHFIGQMGSMLIWKI